jgi:anti-sigma regulatory factor (Ser/Thr protein kinase)
MATVEMSFTPLPAHVRTARLVATAVARRSGVDEALLDEVRLAVGEACSRAVEAHRLHCPGEPVEVALTGTGDRFEVVVRDRAAGGHDERPAAAASSPAAAAAVAAPATAGAALAGFSAAPQELGLAVIAGLADDVEVARTPAGLTIRMSWPSAAAR